MSVDVPKVLAHKFKDVVTSYTERDVALYALTVGAAEDPLEADDLKLVYELHEDFAPLPTFAVVFPFAGMAGLTETPGLSFHPMMLLHGEQEVRLNGALPPSGTITSKMRVSGVYDKGKGALVHLDSQSFDESGREVCSQRSSVFIRGIGGFGGPRGPKAPEWSVPKRAPDASIKYKTASNQALTYRLNGDTNPLHADPQMAAMGGFDRPILHGLCSFGVAGRCIVKALCGNDVSKLKSIKGRFAKHVFPGETLVTDMWRQGSKVWYRTKVVERDSFVITNGMATLEGGDDDGTAAGDESKAAAAGDSASFFEAMRLGVEANGAELVKQVKGVIHYQIRNPDVDWTVDLKNGTGSVVRGKPAKADVTVSMTDADFVALATKKLNPQQAFMRGKIKIKGNMGLAMKLGKVLEAARPASKM